MSSRRLDSSGFTLMEMLVAVIIVGLTVTVFFQLLSSSMRLTIRGRELLDVSLQAHDFFEELLERDVRGEFFKFENQEGEFPWELKIYPVDVEPEDDPDDEVRLNYADEVYAYELTWYFSEEKIKSLKYMRYKAHPKGYFDDDFKAEHISDPPEAEDGSDGQKQLVIS